MRRLAESIVAAEETARILAVALRPPEVEGVVQPFSLDVTPEHPIYLRPVHPWWSIYIWNDGPDEVHAYVNGRERSFDLSQSESREINMGAPKIWEVVFMVDEGKTAHIRMDSKR